MYRFRSLLKHDVVKNSGWMLAGFAAKLAFQFIAFIFLARYLGPKDFGVFTSSFAIVTFLSPFVELGAYNIIISDISGGVSPNLAIGNSILLSAYSLPLGFLSLIFLKIIILPTISWNLIICLGIADFIGARLIQIGNGFNVAKGVLWRTAATETIGGIFRLGLVMILIYMNGNVIVWGYFYLIQMLFMGLFSLSWAVYSSGYPRFKLGNLLNRANLGFHFAVGSAAQSAHSDLDKAMLARLSTLESTGIYSVAYRFITIAYLPMNAFLTSVYPRFFKQGLKGFSHARDLAIKILPLTTGYGILITLVLFFASPLLVFLLGSDFQDSVLALKILCFVPLIQGLYYPFADAITGSGKQYIRTFGQIGALLINLILNLIFIPKFGWKAAAYATIVSQMFVFVFFGFYSFRKLSIANVLPGEIS